MATGTLAISGVVSAFRKPLDDLYEKLKTTGKTSFALRANARALKSMHARLTRISQVKTLWNLEEPISLYKFYYPSSVSTQKDRSRINSLAES
jgi:hypothetical protein